MIWSWPGRSQASLSTSSCVPWLCRVTLSLFRINIRGLASYTSQHGPVNAEYSSRNRSCTDRIIWLGLVLGNEMSFPFSGLSSVDIFRFFRPPLDFFFRFSFVFSRLVWCVQFSRQQGRIKEGAGDRSLSAGIDSNTSLHSENEWSIGFSCLFNLLDFRLFLCFLFTYRKISIFFIASVHRWSIRCASTHKKAKFFPPACLQSRDTNITRIKMNQPSIAIIDRRNESFFVVFSS